MPRQQLTEVINQILRDQTDRKDLIETIWLLYAKSIGIPSGGIPWIECRRAFFVGALTLFESINMIIEPGSEITDKDLRRMDLIDQELNRFRQEIYDGRA